MKPDEIMVYTGTAIVPAVTGFACFLALVAVYRKSISVLSSCVVFVITLPFAMFLSFAFVWRFGYLLHGDGALAIIAAPVTGAILTVPIALIFAVVLTVIAKKKPDERGG
jgi:hypothetical protein